MLSTVILAAGDKPNPLLPALPDLLWGTIAFIIVAVAVYKFGWPAFSDMLEERAAKIERGLEAADRARAEIADERKVLEGQLSEAHREAAEIRERATENARTIVADAQNKAKDEAASILDANQRRIAADTETASRALRSDVGAVATELAGRIVGEAITDQALASRVIDRFLDELEASATAKVGVKES
ncbi:F-type H+-transporting ATPase subunit b [Arcanobacterium wilhelmae]|uniref:ATP synthase subunit b n=1 Tax=Arcanobacterium wilhelmae TaxID=1803177 RepID=A0ABT9NAS8_9ACTO|nr:F0F1 ATP synthase subunit B [Arcanobacterium wilhelmae]MDP9800506.1 F-type H+-transporting ATPase subunit b [Arcanobacterium wilhelmae]WFN89925.1 F0F1 ATP synthase subunit B [Arcanobacterium wilhelmae]